MFTLRVMPPNLKAETPALLVSDSTGRSVLARHVKILGQSELVQIGASASLRTAGPLLVDGVMVAKGTTLQGIRLPSTDPGCCTG